MIDLHVGDIVQNSVQRAIVRWIGSIEDIPVIGLQLIDLTLPGYTDGVCPYNHKRYFNCPHGQGYYVLETGFTDSYKMVQKNNETSKNTTLNEEFNPTEHFLSTSPVHVPISSEPMPSISSPSVSQIPHNPDNDHVISSSSSRGVLRRLTCEREQRKNQQSSSLSTEKNPLSHSLLAQSDSSSSSSSRIYHPENYRSASYDQTHESEVYEFTAYDDHNENETNLPSLPITITNNQLSSSDNFISFGHEYFLDTWTLGRVVSLLENEIPLDNQFCLNICIDHCNVQHLIDEQINGCLSLVSHTPASDIRIELIKIFDNVEIIFPSRAIRLHDNDYLLLAILCFNNECAYVRTRHGWAYTDDDTDNRQSIIVDEVSQMIDETNSDPYYKSEQCLHVLKNASYLYYKLVQ